MPCRCGWVRVEHRRLAVHRTIVVVDIEGFGDPHRSKRNQTAVHGGLYKVMRAAFYHVGIPWAEDDNEDRGDGIFSLIPAEIPRLVRSPRCGALRRPTRSYRSYHHDSATALAKHDPAMPASLLAGEADHPHLRLPAATRLGIASRARSGGYARASSVRGGKRSVMGPAGRGGVTAPPCQLPCRGLWPEPGRPA